MDNKSYPLLTRKQAVELVCSEIGVPLTLSRFDKESMDGRAPKPTAFFGRRQLYSRDAVLAWARTLIKPAQPEPANPQ